MKTTNLTRLTSPSKSKAVLVKLGSVKCTEDFINLRASCRLVGGGTHVRVSRSWSCDARLDIWRGWHADPFLVTSKRSRFNSMFENNKTSFSESLGECQGTINVSLTDSYRIGCAQWLILYCQSRLAPSTPPFVSSSVYPAPNTIRLEYSTEETFQEYRLG